MDNTIETSHDLDIDAQLLDAFLVWWGAKERRAATAASPALQPLVFSTALTN
jgi:hypothetical protein